MLRKITETVHGFTFSTSLILCTNLECQNYGLFKQQTVDSVIPYVCEDCKKKNNLDDKEAERESTWPKI